MSALESWGVAAESHLVREKQQLITIIVVTKQLRINYTLSFETGEFICIKTTPTFTTTTTTTPFTSHSRQTSPRRNIEISERLRRRRRQRKRARGKTKSPQEFLFYFLLLLFDKSRWSCLLHLRLHLQPTALKWSDSWESWRNWERDKQDSML